MGRNDARPRQSAMLDREAGRTIFGAGAQAYDAVRSGYPPALFTHLRRRARHVDAILEIGPGSGIATQGLLNLRPARYTGVESDPDFVAFLGARYSGNGIRFVNASFPCEGLEGPFDIAACAAAFHWLDPEQALKTVRTLLRKDGIWAMWWNSYLSECEGHEFACRAMTILREEGVALPPSFQASGHSSLDVAAQTALLRAAGLREIEWRNWRVERDIDSGFARLLFDSFSFVRLLPEPRRQALLDRIERLVADEFGGAARNLVLTSCYSARN